MSRLLPASPAGRGLLWCLCSVALVTLAQLALKYAMLRLPAPSFEDAAPLLDPRRILPLSMLLGGLLCYGVSMLCWFLALRRLPLNYAYPMLSLSYALVYLLAVVLPWFAEPATPLKTIGLLFILFGIWLIHTNRPNLPNRPNLTDRADQADKMDKRG